MKVRGFKELFYAGAACIALTCGTSAWAQDKVFNIPSEEAGKSIPELARQAGIEIIAPGEALHGVVTPALNGSMDVHAALGVLLTGTDLQIGSDNGQTIVLVTRSKKEQAASAGTAAQNPETVVVTGTHIAGEGPVGSEVTIYSRTDLDQSGAGTLDQFARMMPENLSSTDGISNVFSKNQLAAHPGQDANNNAGTAFNLGGLGVSATLTLVDGHRIAPSGSIGSFVDASMIPFSAVDHLEVLPDGASSIYGSDAVAGVVNIIMRKDFDGAESSVRYGGSTDGGNDEVTVSQLVGKAWSTGNIMLNYEYDENTGLDAAQRSYIGPQGGPVALIPKTLRNSFFLTGNEDIDSDTTLSGEAMYSHKNIFLDSTIASPAEAVSTTQPGSVSQTGGTLTLDRKLGDDWHVSLTGNYSAINQVFNQHSDITIPAYDLTEDAGGPQSSHSKTWGFDALASGTVLSLPGGDVKAAVGGAYRFENYQVGTVYTVSESYLGFNFPTTVTDYIYPTYSRHVESAYGELLIPIVGDGNAMPFVQHLDVSAAFRYDNYSDFGSTTNPKIGLKWAPIDELSFRGSWGTSYRAPLLTELDSPIDYSAAEIPDGAAPGGYLYTLDVGGGNPNLKPETAKVISAGADWQPHGIPGLKLSVTYTHIDYTNLIGIPPVTNEGTVFSDPILAPYINYSPNLAYVTSAFHSFGFLNQDPLLGPSNIQAIFDQQDTNLASEVETTLDLHATYSVPTDVGQFTFQGALDHYITDELKTAMAAPEFELLDTFGEPLRWKNRDSITWSKDGFSAGITINYANAYADTLMTPAGRIAAWTTADLYLGYAMGPSDSGSLLENFRVALTMQNIFDTKPPYVQFPASDLLPGQNPIPYDPVNGSPVGRLIAIQLTKDF